MPGNKRRECLGLSPSISTSSPAHVKIPLTFVNIEPLGTMPTEKPPADSPLLVPGEQQNIGPGIELQQISWMDVRIITIKLLLTFDRQSKQKITITYRSFARQDPSYLPRV